MSLPPQPDLWRHKAIYRRLTTNVERGRANLSRAGCTHNLEMLNSFPFSFDENAAPPEQGPKLAPADVNSFAEAPLYDLKTLRTLFLEFRPRRKRTPRS